jgi:hypothetical protein
LWDRSGPADPDLARLEQVLGALRHAGRRPSFAGERRSWPVRLLRHRVPLAAAAALIVAVGAGWFVLLGGAAWRVRTISGLPTVDGRSVPGGGRIAGGEWLVTDGTSRARIDVGRIGRVEVEPNTRVQVVTTAGRDHRMALERGTIHARIWAPPKFFYVETEAAVAVDLGCAYTLQVGEDGSGLLRVTHGWVGFERGRRETYVPEGAVVMTRADKGPGTPRYEDAPSGYGPALMRLDFGPPDGAGRAAALDLVLSTARRRDALTLWHLLTTGSREERSRVFDRLAGLVPPPAGVTRDQVLDGDREALDRWWDALGIEVSTWWRLFKKKW